MNYINIFFPFSSMNDNNYQLRLTLNGSSVSGALAALDADTEVFTKGIVNHVGSDTIYNYTGTLTGSVKATDNERNDFFEPLVTSKLSFNMAVQTFPAWLMAFCANYTAKVVLVRIGGQGTVMWRGYVVGQTLNMTVVNHLLAVQLVAVDEVAMAKYMNFKQTMQYVANQSYGTLVELMELYFDLHYVTGLHSGTPGFSWVYGRDGYTASNLMLWQRDLQMVDDDGNDVTDLPNTLVINYDRWLQDDEATWEDVFEDLFTYLGVTFSVGGWLGTSGCDCWMLTTPGDNTTVVQYVYNLYTHLYTSDSLDRFEMIENPTKVGANLQITTEPDRYKKAIVTSTPQRWEKHEYLKEEHYKDIDENKCVRYEWGITGNYENGPFSEYGWHKLRYIKPDIEEDDYLTIAPCADGEGLVMAREGILPYDDIDSCTGLTAPTSAVADSLDFITFKEGCCCIRMGSGTLSGDNEDSNLNYYFLLMNHMWQNMIHKKDYVMQNAHVADTNWVSFRPLGAVKAVHPSDKHYLQISMDVMFVRENMPSNGNTSTYSNINIWFKSPNLASDMEIVDWNTPAMIMPSDQTYFDYSDESDTNQNFHGKYCANLLSWTSLSFKAYIRVGKHYFNGSTWEYVAEGGTPPKCTVSLHSSTSEVDEISKTGIFTIATKNYYYVISNPWRGDNSIQRNSNPKMRGNMGGLSIHNLPVDGQLEMQILGQVDFINANEGVYNSIPFILINNIDIGYTDDAELTGKDIGNEHTQVMSTSPTKEELKRSVKMASPSVDGFFSNVLVYDGGKSWHNLKQVKSQTGSPLMAPPEWWLAWRLGQQYAAGQLFVELETPVLYNANVHNVNFHVLKLTEASGDFLPVKREFDYVKETMKVKLMRTNSGMID